MPGRREDGADLIADWRRDKLQRRVVHAFIWDTESLRAQNLDKTDYLLGELREQSSIIRRSNVTREILLDSLETWYSIV